MQEIHNQPLPPPLKFKKKAKSRNSDSKARPSVSLTTVDSSLRATYKSHHKHVIELEAAIASIQSYSESNENDWKSCEHLFDCD